MIYFESLQACGFLKYSQIVVSTIDFFLQPISEMPIFSNVRPISETDNERHGPMLIYVVIEAIVSSEPALTTLCLDQLAT